MRFSARLPNDTATLLLMATFIIVLIALANRSHDPASHHVEDDLDRRRGGDPGRLRRLAAQYLTPTSAGAHEIGEPPRVCDRVSLIAARRRRDRSAFVSDWFVHALEPTIHTLHISQAFAGLVIVAIAGNAVENVAGIVLAYKGQSDLAISVVKNSVAQIAAFLFPLLVLVSLLTATTLTFALAPVYAGALFGTAVIIWQITGDGEATPFEGAALVAIYVILATVAAFE